jgi:hypothetical protein
MIGTAASPSEHGYDRSGIAHRSPRNRVWLRYVSALMLMFAAIGGSIYYFLRGEEMPAPRQIRELTLLNIVPPPPPLPPPPPPEQKMIEAPKPTEADIREDAPVETPKDAPPDLAKSDEPPPGPLAIDAKPVGPGDLFNLGGKPGGSGYGGGGGGGSALGRFTAIVTKQLQEALAANPKTRSATMQIRLRVWADSTGRVRRIELVSSSGNAEIDAAIRTEVFAGLVLREPPPPGVPMPIVTRVTERPG